MSLWKGNITFGLVSIPIILYNSIDSSSNLSFHQINLKTGARIKYKRVDEETGREVPWENIGRGYEYEKGKILILAEDELKRVAGDNARTIAIEEFIDAKNIHYLNIKKTYYLAPDKKGDKGYVILREALKKTGKVGIAKVIISTKEYLAAIATFENALVLYLMYYEDELRKLSEFNIPSANLKKYKATSKEVQIASKLIDAMSEKWRPEQFKDEYRIAVDKWVKAKLKKRPQNVMKARTVVDKTVNSADFIELLKQSIGSKHKKHNLENRTIH